MLDLQDPATPHQVLISALAQREHRNLFQMYSLLQNVFLNSFKGYSLLDSSRRRRVLQLTAATADGADAGLGMVWTYTRDKVFAFNK